MTDAYQAPAFSWIHAAQDAGSAALTLAQSITAGSQKTWLMDRMGRLAVVWNASGNKTISLDRGEGPFEPVNRFVLLPGHNLDGKRILFDADDSVTPWSSITALFAYGVARGTVLTTASNGYTIRPGLNVWDFPDIPYRYIRTRLDGGPTVTPECAEWWWTRRNVPTVGLDPSYEPSIEARASIDTLQSGVQTALQTGPTQREIDLTAAPVSTADFAIYEQMLAASGVRRDPILFDGTRVYEEQILALESTGGVAAVNCTLDTTTGYTGTNCVRFTRTGTDPGIWITIPATDMRRCLLGVAVRIETDISWLSGSAGMRVYLSSTDTSHACVWNRFGTDYMPDADQWRTLWVDLDTAPSSQLGNRGFDPAAVTLIGIYATGATAGIKTRVDHGVLVHKDRAPMLCRVSAKPSWKQARSIPASGQLWTPQLTLTEVGA